MLILSVLSAALWQGILATFIVDGYTSKLSAFPGDSISLYFNASQSNSSYEVGLYDMQGEIVSWIVADVSPQPAISKQAYEVGYNYKCSAKIKVPDLESGVYLLDNKIPFIVKSRNPKIVVVYSSNTENAYCNAGGKSLYGFNSSNSKGAVRVSFKRPVGIEKFGEAFFRWIVKQNFEDVGYVCDVDMDEYKEISKARLLIITGHSEYWTFKARKNFDRFIDEGNDALVLSGNTMWWQVRYNKNRDQLLCYRNPFDDKIKYTKLKTVLWNDPSLGYPILSSIGADFSFAGYGDRTDKGWDGYKIVAESPLLEGTGLRKGDILPLSSRETDGPPVTMGVDGIPVLDNSKLKFHRAEIVGFDHVLRSENTDGTSAWIVFRRTNSSGVVINVASTNWCAYNGIGKSAQIQRITENMIQKLLKRENVFSSDETKILHADMDLRPIE